MINYYFAYPIQNMSDGKIEFGYRETDDKLLKIFPGYNNKYQSYNCKWLYPSESQGGQTVICVNEKNEIVEIGQKQFSDSVFFQKKSLNKNGWRKGLHDM